MVQSPLFTSRRAPVAQLAPKGKVKKVHERSIQLICEGYIYKFDGVYHQMSTRSSAG